MTEQQIKSIVDNIISDHADWVARTHSSDDEWGHSHAHYCKSEREAIEQEFRNRGYEVKRELRLSSGQRTRGLWFRKQATGSRPGPVFSTTGHAFLT
jgi:hypothetical protein